jgi:hypothetical protein
MPYRPASARRCSRSACAGRESSRAWSPIGITNLRGLTDRDPYQLAHEVNVAAGRPIWHSPIATQAMTNLIAAAQREPNTESSRLPPR